MRGDATADLQARFDAAVGQGALVLPAGVYRITRNLYLHGRFDLVADGAVTILLDADLNDADGHEYWINGGVKAKGQLAAPWNGRIEGVRFVVTARGVCDRILNVHRGDDWRVERCIFDVTARGANPAANGGIGCYNNAAWCDHPVKREGRINACRFLAAQAAAHGSEAIGLGNAQRTWITGNVINGWGDDAIGLHTCEDFAVENNYCATRDGRIYLSGSRRGWVRGNHVERIADPDGTWVAGGALIGVEIEAASQPAPSALVIAENQLFHGAGIATPTYGIRLRAVRDTRVAGNLIHDDSGNGYGITWEGQIPPAGWSDSDGLDRDGKARVRNLRVAGNMTSGKTRMLVGGELAVFPGGVVGSVVVAP